MWATPEAMLWVVRARLQLSAASSGLTEAYPGAGAGVGVRRSVCAQQTIFLNELIAVGSRQGDNTHRRGSKQSCITSATGMVRSLLSGITEYRRLHSGPPGILNGSLRNGRRPLYPRASPTALWKLPQALSVIKPLREVTAQMCNTYRIRTGFPGAQCRASGSYEIPTLQRSNTIVDPRSGGCK